MKILHIISGDLFAGAEIQILYTLQSLNSRSNGIQCYCILFNNGLLEQRLNKAGILTFVINEKLNNIFAIVWKIGLILNRLKPDLIHVHRVKEHFAGAFSQIITFKFKPIIRTVHGLNCKPKHNTIKQFKWFLTTLTDRLLIQFFSNSAIAVSNDMYAYLRSLKSASRIVKIYNTINLSDYTIPNLPEIINTTRHKYFIDKSFWVGSAARLAQPKNQGIFIEAAHQIAKCYPDTFKFSIFGDGPQKDELRAKIDNLHLSNSFFLHGFEQNIISVIASFDIFILCSFHEGLPMALLEAMALGKAVICTAVGGIKEVITSYKNGILIPSNDSAALAQAINLLYSNHSLRQSISENAKIHIQTYFTIETTIGRLINHYSHCSGSCFV